MEIYIFFCSNILYNIKYYKYSQLLLHLKYYIYILFHNLIDPGKYLIEPIFVYFCNTRIWSSDEMRKSDRRFSVIGSGRPQIAQTRKFLGFFVPASIWYVSNNAAGIQYAAQLNLVVWHAFLAGNETTVERAKKIIPVPNTVERRHNDTKRKILDIRSHASLLCHKTKNEGKNTGPMRVKKWRLIE